MPFLGLRAQKVTFEPEPAPPILLPLSQILEFCMSIHITAEVCINVLASTKNELYVLQSLKPVQNKDGERADTVGQERFAGQHGRRG